jgi:hypothetical protein
MIEDLSRIQRDFDVSRGFAELPFAPGRDDPDALARLEYSLIGMTGEVGEIANILKRARRSSSTGRASGGLAELPGEVADVLSYLLKFSVQAGINPVEAYLTKMCLNAHRFRHPGDDLPRTISLCGPPGSGKSSLAGMLAAEHPGWAVYREDFEANPHLGDLQDVKAKFNADASQSWFLERIAAFLADEPHPPIILDQDPTAIPLIYGQLLVEDGRLSRQALERHLSTLVRLEIDRADRLANRRVVLLDAAPEVLAPRCVGKFGTLAAPSFLARIRNHFLKVFAKLPGTVVIDCSGPIDSVLREVSMVVADAIPTVNRPDAA